MVTVKSHKTKVEHTFTNENWELMKDNGLHKKYKVLSQLSAPANEVKVRFSPPELKENKAKTKVKVDKNKS